MNGQNQAPRGERTHIAFFGRRNVGKSSLVNAVTNQALSIVSDTPGTTTDPVKKAMELLPLGPVVIVDTPGLDDTGELGEKRVARTRRVLGEADIAVVVTDTKAELGELEKELISQIRDYEIPFLVVRNKADLMGRRMEPGEGELFTSAKEGTGIEELKERLGAMRGKEQERRFMEGLLSPGMLVVLVCPIDESAPKGRLILPQQMALREILNAGAVAIVVRETELKEALREAARLPDLVVTDSQVFKEVAELLPEKVRLTSFSILMAEYKGFLEAAVQGVSRMTKLLDGDTVLVAEGCTHHRQCGDIGTVKLPKWLREYTGRQLRFESCSGDDFPEDLSPYALVIHCGGCMLTEREVTRRMRSALRQGVPFTNYGTVIAEVKGTLRRSLEAMQRKQEA